MAHRQQKQHGFTIVEFMIAIGVFSVLALISTMAVIQLQKSYQLSATKAKLLAASRQVHSEFTQNVELGSDISSSVDTATISGTTYNVWCAGTTRFLWLESSNAAGVVRDASGGALYQDTVDGVGNCTDTTMHNPKDLLPNTGFVAIFDPGGGSDGVYSLKTRFAVGQRDMFVNTTVPAGDVMGNCQSNSFLGLEFCAVVEYNNTAIKKVQ